MSNNQQKLARFRRYVLVGLHDLFCAVMSYWSAAAIILPLQQFAVDVDMVLQVACVAGGLSLAFSRNFGVFSTHWRLASLIDFVALIRSAASVTFCLLILRQIYHTFYPEPLFIAELRVLLLGGVLTLGSQAAGRILYRYHHARRRQAVLTHQDATIFIGHLNEAESAIKAAEQGMLSANIVACLVPVGHLAPKTIRGRLILGQATDIEYAFNQCIAGGIPLKSALLSQTYLAEAGAQAVKRTARRLGLTLLKVETVGLGGRSEIRFEDFLFRTKRVIDHAAIDSAVRDKTLFITGGGGTVGGDIALRAAAHNARKIVLADISEAGLQRRAADIRRDFPGCDIHLLICDVRDFAYFSEKISRFAPDVIVHAAALKHVDLLENNWQPAISTNVLGTANVLRAADEYRVPMVINISTDKAVEPVGVLGLTKRAGEKLVTDSSAADRLRRYSVRFGNVLGSSGSVIEVFLDQIAAGGPVTLTDERMERFFMSRTEAAELVLASASLKDGASLYHLDMGEPIKIKDLAMQLIEWAGLVAGDEIKIEVVGARPGERLTEKLIAAGETQRSTAIEGIIALTGDQRDPACDVLPLVDAVADGNLTRAQQLLGAELLRETTPT